MFARLLVPLALLAAAPAAGQSPADGSLAGSWALQMDGTTIFRFDLTQGAKGKWRATWSRPGTFASDGNHFRKVSGPVHEVHSATGIVLPNDNGIEISFDDPRPGAIPDIFDFRMLDPDAVRMTYVGTGLAPYTLQRVKAGAPLGPWDPARTYGRESAAVGAEAAPNKKPEVTFGRGTKQTPPPDQPPPSDAVSFKLPPGAPVGR